MDLNFKYKIKIIYYSGPINILINSDFLYLAHKRSAVLYWLHLTAKVMISSLSEVNSSKSLIASLYRFSSFNADARFLQVRNINGLG